MAMTRRGLILGLAASAGSAPAFAAMRALELGGPGAQPAPVQLARRPARPGVRVAVVGAGMAGLISAYELTRLGYDVTLYEAASRVGGRNLTLRDGDALKLDDGSSQAVRFGPSQYFNAGPARLASGHRHMLGYCREFGIPLEVMVHASRSARYRGAAVDGGKPVQMRQVVNDARGMVAEWLAKSLDQGALDAELAPDDRGRLREFLRTYGDLAPDGRYRGSLRSGFAVAPKLGDTEWKSRDPLGMQAFLDPAIWRAVLDDDQILYQATMLQPVGGMDRIADALAERLPGVIRTGHALKSVRLGAGGVDLVFEAAGGEQRVHADFAIAAIPLPALAGVDSNLDAAFQRDLRKVRYQAACKVAWRSPRFWEDEGIYGGMSYLDQDTQLVWYPSAGFHQAEGVLVACYNDGEAAARYTARPLAQQYADSRRAVELLHPGQSQKLADPLAIAWQKVPYAHGAWVGWDEQSRGLYPTLSRPQGNLYIAGDQVSYLPGWQEGAALSALNAVNGITAHASQAA